MARRLTVREAAARTGLSIPTIRRRVRSGQLPSVRVPGPFGEQVEIPEEALGPERPARREITGDDRTPDQSDHGTGSMITQPDPSLPGAEYWRGRWEEQRESLRRLEALLGEALARLESGPPREEGGGAVEEELREALRTRSQELAQARNVIDSLRREKARRESEAEALRGQVRRLSEATTELVDPSREGPQGGARRFSM